jgi:hypothetical protein
LLASSATDGPKRTHVAAIFITTGCCATVEIINYRPFAAAIVIFVRSAAS